MRQARLKKVQGGFFTISMAFLLCGCVGGGDAVGQNKAMQDVNGAGQELQTATSTSLKLTSENKSYEMSEGGSLRGETTHKHVIFGGGNPGTSQFVNGERQTYGDPVPTTYIPAGDMSRQVRVDPEYTVKDFRQEEKPMTVQDLENSGIPIQKMR